MSILSEFYVAMPEQAAEYDADRNVLEAERAEFKGLTCEECASLWAILRGDEPTPEHADAFESVLEIDGGQRLINRFPPNFVELLAALDAAGGEAAASQWIQTGELAYLSCEAADVLPVIESLSRLSRLARETNRSLYLWMCV